jgi:hypothetical protein
MKGKMGEELRTVNERRVKNRGRKIRKRKREKGIGGGRNE